MIQRSHPSVVRVCGTVVWLTLLAAAGCGPGPALRGRLGPDVVRPRPGVVLLLADGIGADVIEDGCRSGRLPNIRRRFVAAGARTESALGCIPPITYAAICSLLTGSDPARHRIVGNRWFDPAELSFRNYVTAAHYRDVNLDTPTPLIYERLYPALTVSIQAAHVRGVTYDFTNWAPSGVLWLLGDYTAVDKLSATTFERVAERANSDRRWPTLVTCYFPGADSVGHEHGVSAPQYRTAVEHIDYQVGRICDWLEAQGLLSSTYLVFVTDHGMFDNDPRKVVDLTQLVRDGWGRDATDAEIQDGSRALRRRAFDPHDTVVAYQNGRGAFLYFKGPGGWGDRPTPAAVGAVLTAPPPAQQLWNLPAVDVVTYLESDTVAVVRSAAGTARIRVEAGPRGLRYAYVPDSADVFGYTADPALAAFVAGGPHSSREWLAATAGHEYPDVVPHLVGLLHEPRAGQVVVFTQPGYSFVPERGGHGGLRRAERRVPLLLAGPGIRGGTTLPAARSTDLVPTLLELLGREVPADEWLDGESLAPQLRSAAESVSRSE